MARVAKRRFRSRRRLGLRGGSPASSRALARVAFFSSRESRDKSRAVCLVRVMVGREGEGAGFIGRWRLFKLHSV